MECETEDAKKPLAVIHQSTIVIQSLARNAAGVITVAGVLYLLLNSIDIPTYGWMFFFGVLAGLYGAESVTQVLQFRNGGKK